MKYRQVERSPRQVERSRDLEVEISLPEPIAQQGRKKQRKAKNPKAV
jgi:hypothetical protein